MNKKYFIQHVLLCLVACAGFVWAWYLGAPQKIWHDDVSMMTSVIGAVFLAGAARMGWDCWNLSAETTDSFGAFSAGLCTMLGLLGTTTGFRSLSTLDSGLAAIPTIIATTQVGVLGSILLGVLAYNLNAGIKAARRGQ